MGGGARPYTVKNCQFEKAYCNIITSGVNNFTITNNQFKLKDNYPSSSPGFGIILNKANKFTISGNQFSNSNISASQTGINIIATHPTDKNYISKDNVFTNLTNGILTTSTEVSNSLNENLYLTCNDFDKCVNDIKLTVGTSINAIQRFGNASAGNTFSQTANIYQYSNNTQAIPDLSYWYNNLNSIEYPERRVRVTPSIHGRPLNIPRCYVQPCPPPCSPDTRYQELITSKNDLIGELNQLLDNGESSNWLLEIQNANSNNSSTLYYNLTNLSPNISPNLMIAFWQRTDLYSMEYRLHLLQANMDLMENDDFRKYFLANSSDFNSDTLAVLLSSVAPNSNRKIMEDSIRQVDVELNLLIDTTILVLYSQEEIDSSILVWYDRIGSLDAKIDKSLFQIHNYNFTEANTTITQILNMNGLSTFDSTERANFINLVSLLDTVYINSRYEGNLDTLEIQGLINVAESSNSRSTQIASNILKFYYDIIPQGNQYLMSNGTIIQSESNLTENNIFAESKTPIINIYPNPASNHIEIKTQCDNEVIISIFDVFGILNYSTYLTKSKLGSISTQGWRRGIYFIKAEANGKSETKKLILH